MVKKQIPVKILRSNYERLTKWEKDVLYLSSIAYEPLTQTKLMNCLRQWGFKDGNNKAVNHKNVKSILEKLLGMELMVYDDSWQCNPLMVEEISRYALADGVFHSMLEATRSIYPLVESYYSSPANAERCAREIRAALYQEDYPQLKKNLDLAYRYFKNFEDIRLVARIFNSPFDANWFQTLPMDFQASALLELVPESLRSLLPVDDFLPFLKKYRNNNQEDYGLYFRDELITFYILQGRFQEALEVCSIDSDMGYTWARKGWVHFLTGKNEEALGEFSAALKDLQKSHRKKKVFFLSMCGLFHILALLKTEDPSHYSEILEFVEYVKKNDKRNIKAYQCLKAIVFARKNMLVEAESVLQSSEPDVEDGFLSYYFYSIATLWFFPDKLAPYKPRLKKLYHKATRNNYQWAAMELAAILSRLFPGEAGYKDYIQRAKLKTGAVSFFSFIKIETAWERSLKALERLGSVESEEAVKTTTTRLAWFLSSEGHYAQPREQKITGSGNWSKGRPVALKRLMSGDVSCMTLQDHKIAATIREEEYTTYGYYKEIQYVFNWEKTMVALAGHPLIFLEESPGTPVVLVKKEPELLVERKGKNFEIKFSVDISEKGVEVVKESPTRFNVIEITKAHQDIRQIFGAQVLEVPETGKNHIVKAVKNLSSFVTVHSDIDAGAADIPSMEADPKICVLLTPVGAGVKLELFVKPFRQGGPYFKPGFGGTNVFAEMEGKRVKTRRDLEKEKENAREVMNSSPSLAGVDQAEYEWLYQEPEECLEVLMDLERLKEMKKVSLEWPKGEKFRLRGAASFDRMRLSLGKTGDWFELSGELKVDEGLTLDIQRLLELVEENPTRFLPLGEGQFLAMTREFQKRVKELAAYSDKKGKALRLHPLAALAVSDLTDKVKELKGDKGWNSQLKRMEKAMDHRPVLPSTLRAELRDYQVEGFNWLSRLAMWGVGACLADDMGLGKTLQALAALLERAPKGPSLVVAPASVCMNWQKEAARFAPTLNIILFGGKGRDKALKGLKPFDMLICSYGLLHNEAEKLTKVKWGSIVLDEAQAIKNFTTKRSKAAMQLKGGFKIITTGTPVENHLAELWNLFGFINPGLLGSQDSFNRRFAIPVEKTNDADAGKRLKRLIRPFILRRLKSQVLEELPPKTEITLTVELTNEESAFYEALRRNAVTRIESAEGPAGKKQFRILAEIMKLRRACCHSSLALPESNLESSKLELFSQVVGELRENRHKALVFSQFVDHLAIIRKRVEKMGLSCQYLDGGTPLKERAKRVEAFQAGEGDLFLISLKAGGLGLNLTAADYVIHMDPWWNPAVEVQASDRAHRIGQERPVTIYRLVTKNTIEEKITAMHQAKRNLADSLLEGSEGAGKISAEELLALIKEV